MLQFVANAIVARGVREFNTHTRVGTLTRRPETFNIGLRAPTPVERLCTGVRVKITGPRVAKGARRAREHTMDAIIDFKVVWLAESHVAVPGAKCRIEKLE